jgi:dihydropyrimidinase
MKRWIIRNVKIVKPGGIVEGDITIENAVIKATGSPDGNRFDHELDGRGAVALPGLIDPHVHFELPVAGRVSEDNFYSGGVRALYGGVTTVLDFSTPSDSTTLDQSVEERKKIAGKSPVDFSLHATVCRWNRNRETEALKCLEKGVSSFKFFTAYEESGRRTPYEEIHQAADFLYSHDALLTFHAEDQHHLKFPDNISDDLFARYAYSRPVEAEAVAINKLVKIQETTGSRMYIVHLSSRAGLQAAENSRLLIETCPHYLVLDQSKYLEPWGYRYAVAPPLRDRGDISSLWTAIQDGKVNTIGTDHCPFPLAEQDRVGDHFMKSPFGLAGVETLLPLLVTYGVEHNRLDWCQLAHLTAESPAKIFSLYPRKGCLEPGSDADIVLMDDRFEQVEPRHLHGSSNWNPYTGLLLTGWPHTVISRGDIVVRNRECCAEKGRGLFLHRTP